MLKICLLFLLFQEIVLSNVVRSDVPVVCTMDKVEHKIGDKWSSKGKCQLYHCLESGDIISIGCALVDIPSGSKCHLTQEDNSLTYPDCCPQVICPK